LEDLFIAHIGAMDTLAFALKKAAQIRQDNILKKMVDERYQSYETTELGKKVEQGTATLADCEKFIMDNGEPKVTSAKQEKFERVFNNYFV
jgi:xylose isomerase